MQGEDYTNSVLHWQARLIERNAMSLAHWIETTDAAKLNWSPGEKGQTKARTIMSQGAECVESSRRLTALLTDGEMPPSPTYESRDIMVKDIVTSARELAEVVRGLQPADLTRAYQTPFGPMAGSMLLEIAANNLMYHAGVVNAYQLMYGDTEFSIPPHVFA